MVDGLEHKNMPVEDALALVDRDFQRYMMSVREGRIPPRRAKSEVSSLLSQVASGGQVSADQLQHVIDALQKKKQANGRLQAWTSTSLFSYQKNSKTTTFLHVIHRSSLFVLVSSFFLPSLPSLSPLHRPSAFVTAYIPTPDPAAS